MSMTYYTDPDTGELLTLPAMEKIARVKKYGLHGLPYDERAGFLIALCNFAISRSTVVAPTAMERKNG